VASATELVFDAAVALTIDLGGLASAAGRQSDFLSNSSNRPGALVYVEIKSGTAPTAGGVYYIYLLRRDDHASPTVTDDNAGGSDAGITIENAPLLGTIRVTATLNKVFARTFDTLELGPLGPSWTVAVVNATSQALNATGGDHAVRYATYYAEAQ
jgi:hypothetical protein